MQTYHVQPRSDLVTRGALALVVGGCFLVLAALYSSNQGAVSGGDAGDGRLFLQLMTGFLLLFALMPGYVGWNWLRREPYEVQVGDDGVIVFLTAFGHVDVLLGQISSVRIVRRRIYPDNADPRELQVRYTGGLIRLPYFEGAEQLLLSVNSLRFEAWTAHNP